MGEVIEEQEHVVEHVIVASQRAGGYQSVVLKDPVVEAWR
jgi:hypothetical protein